MPSVWLPGKAGHWGLFIIMIAHNGIHGPVCSDSAKCCRIDTTANSPKIQQTLQKRSSRQINGIVFTSQSP